MSRSNSKRCLALLMAVCASAVLAATRDPPKSQESKADADADKSAGFIRRAARIAQ